MKHPSSTTHQAQSLIARAVYGAMAFRFRYLFLHALHWLLLLVPGPTQAIFACSGVCLTTVLPFSRLNKAWPVPGDTRDSLTLLYFRFSSLLCVSWLQATKPTPILRPTVQWLCLRQGEEDISVTCKAIVCQQVAAKTISTTLIIFFSAAT